MIKVLGVIFLVTMLDAKVLEVKQLFNKKIVTVQSSQKAISKTFYATTTLDESKIADVSLRFSGFVEKLYVDKSFMSVQKGEKLFKVYAKALSEIKAEIDLAKEMRQKTVVRNLDKKTLFVRCREFDIFRLYSRCDRTYIRYHPHKKHQPRLFYKKRDVSL